ncbi:MAG: hypothetical protein Hens3KO_20790 [Henriciella sp.]
MDISRRAALTGLATMGVASASACSPSGSSQTQINASSVADDAPPLAPFPPPHTTLLLNYDRAMSVMEEAGVDLILCADPVNIYYLTNQQPISSKLGMDNLAYAALAAGGQSKPKIISGQISEYFSAPVPEASDLVDKIYMGMPADFEDFIQLSDPRAIADAPAVSMFHPREHDDYPKSYLEEQRLKQAFGGNERMYAGIEGAIFSELLDTDMPNKTVAIDHPILRMFIEKSGLDVRIVDGDRLLRRVRLQKSETELAMMRYAATGNARAAHLAAKSLRDGATFREFRQEYTKQCGANAMTARYMMIDTLVPNMTPGTIEEGRSVLIDCVSDFEGYHGDYGRTVCVGEPNARMKKIIGALSDIWDRMLPELKAGVTYGEIFALSKRLIDDANIDTNLAINPHNVGLHHSDEPSAQEFGYFQKEDIVLQENMVLSVDFPLLDVGLGGSAHLEDLVLIGKDGPELLNDSTDRFIMV